MKYQIIFTEGKLESVGGGSKMELNNVLILDEQGDYYHPYFVSLEKLYHDFREKDSCYFRGCIVILHTITKEIILKSIPELHKWLFFKSWLPVPNEVIVESFYPQEKWITYIVEIE